MLYGNEETTAATLNTSWVLDQVDPILGVKQAPPYKDEQKCYSTCPELLSGSGASALTASVTFISTKDSEGPTHNTHPSPASCHPRQGPAPSRDTELSVCSACVRVCADPASHTLPICSRVFVLDLQQRGVNLSTAENCYQFFLQFKKLLSPG